MKKLSKFRLASSIGILSLLFMSSSYASSDSDAALAKAASLVAQAKQVGGEWRLLDSATGSKAGSLSKLLAAAQDKAANGEDDEVIRIANKVIEAAMLGIEQAESQASVSPTY